MRLQQKVWSRSGELKAGEAGRSLNSHRQPEHFKNTSFFFFFFSIYPFMKRWEGSGAVRAQQGSRLKSYLNLEMLFGFTVEVSYQLQFLFECLASFCGSKQEQQERKKESCWQWLNWTDRLQKFKGDGLHSAERSANDPLHFFRSTFCPFKQQFRSHSQTNCEERTDDENRVRSEMISR